MNAFKERLRYQMECSGHGYSDMAEVLGLKSLQAFKYKMDHDSFTRVELLKIKDVLKLGNGEFLELMGIKSEG